MKPLPGRQRGFLAGAVAGAGAAVLVGLVLVQFSLYPTRVSQPPQHGESEDQNAAQSGGSSAAILRSGSEAGVAPPRCSFPSACGVLHYGAQDPLTAGLSPTPSGLWAWHLTDLQLSLGPKGTVIKAAVAPACHLQLPNATRLGQSDSALVSALAAAKPRTSCKLLKGDWFIVSDRKGRAHGNLFDELATFWYPLWLIRRAAGCADAAARPRVLFYNDVLNGMPRSWAGGAASIVRGVDAAPPFQEVLSFLGEYVPWADAVAEAEGGCVQFERAFTTPSSWLWLDKPLPAAASPPLQSFVDGVLGALGLGGTSSARCAHTAVLSARRGGKPARRLVNEDEVLAAAKVALPGFAVRRVDLGALPFREQVATVRGADVFIFPHGGAGPHVLWMRHGAVVIELFPHNDADPVYRNLAVQTSKAYLSWQASDYLRPFKFRSVIAARNVYHFTPASDFRADVAELEPLLHAAAQLVRNTLGTNWFPSGGGEYSGLLCTMCAREGRRHACPPGVPAGRNASSVRRELLG